MSVLLQGFIPVLSCCYETWRYQIKSCQANFKFPLMREIESNIFIRLVMNSQLNLLKKQSGYSQAYADGLLSLLRGKCLRTLFELEQHMLDKIQIWSQNQKLLPRLYPSSDLYNDTETAPVDSILGKNNHYLHILLF